MDGREKTGMLREYTLFYHCYKSCYYCSQSSSTF